jgi:hypothetical protein
MTKDVRVRVTERIDALAAAITPPGGDEAKVRDALYATGEAFAKGLSLGLTPIELLRARPASPASPPPPPWTALLALTPEELVERRACLNLELKWADTSVWIGGRQAAPEWLDQLSGPRDAAWMHAELAAAGVPVEARRIGKLVEVLNARVVAHRQAQGGV